MSAREAEKALKPLTGTVEEDSIHVTGWTGHYKCSTLRKM